MESNNTFNGGMVSDISKLIQNRNTYLQAVNFRPQTELGGSKGSLVNIKGNHCEIGFPKLENVYKFKLNTTTINSQFTLTINNQTTSTITLLESTSTKDIVTFIKGLPNCYETTNGAPDPFPSFSVAYDATYIYLYQTTLYDGCSPSTFAVNVILTTIAHLDGSGDFIFIKPDSTEQVNPGIPMAYIPSNTAELSIIGSTFIGEYFYLYTCPTTNPTEVGQIWEMWYDEVNKETNLKLLYINYLGFSVNYPIAPSATIGRYEIPLLQRIYWTDFNNPVRTVNVKDPNLMALPVEDVNLKPNVKFNVPVLTNVYDGGSVSKLCAGNTFQCAYRLVKNNGAVTSYSILSNIYYATEYSIADQRNVNHNKFAGLTGAATNNSVDKTLEWTVNNVDTNFDTIEFVVIERRWWNSDYSFTKFDTQIINSNTTISTLFISDPDTETNITMDEFLIDSISFTHAKTIESKDNRLFFANVKNDLVTVLDAFDTRVYRFQQGTNIAPVLKYATDTSPTAYAITTVADYATIEETADNIPVFNLGFNNTDDDINTDITAKYRINNPFELGGNGPNISFTFGSTLVRTDAVPKQLPFSVAQSGTDRDNLLTQSLYGGGYRVPGTALYNFLSNMNPINLDTAYQLFKTNDTFTTMGSDYLGGLLKSYQHNEIYRFAIVFHDKSGQSTFAKWIGDIKFPHYKDLNFHGGYTQSGAYQVPDFRSMVYDNTSPSGSLYDTTSGAYSNIPYINFEVNITAELAALISGYEIVRVERKANDRTVAATGLINQVAVNGAGLNPDTYLPVPRFYSIGDGSTTILNPDMTGSNHSSDEVLTFHPFEYLAAPAENYYNDTDRLYITERYRYLGLNAVSPNNVYPVDPKQAYQLQKYYWLVDAWMLNDSWIKIKMTDMQYVDQGGSVTVGGTVYKNWNYATDSSNANKPQSLGSPAMAISTNPATTPLVWDIWSATYTADPNGSKLLAMHVKPGRLANQYGGRTYTDRLNSEYISAQTYQTVTTAGTYTAKTYGGDIYHGILDIQKAIKNWGQGPNVHPTSADGNKLSQTFYFPTQSVFNPELRVGIHINSDLNADSNSGGADSYDTYGYYESYSFENDLRKFYPKPLFFNETNQWNNRVYFSETKINGENTDSWASVLTNNFYDVEGNYGGINALIILKNNMYFVQDRAFGMLMINPVSMTSDNNGLPIKLGKGDTIQRHFYNSIDYGSKHQWSVYRSQNHIIFVDIRNKKCLLFDGQNLTPISDLKGQRNYFIKKLDHSNFQILDNPIIGKGIITSYDYYQNEFLITTLNHYTKVIGEVDFDIIENSTIALVADQEMVAFTGLYNRTPNIYINNNSKLFTSSTLAPAKVYLENIGNYAQFYGTTYKSTLKAIINDNPLKTKIFDNLSWLTESVDDNLIALDDYTPLGLTVYESDDVHYLLDTFKRLRVYNEYQNTDYITLAITNPITNLRKLEQGFNVQIPRNKFNYDTTAINTKSIFDPTALTKTTFGERIRDKYVIVDLEYDNTINNRFVAHNLSSNYRISDR